MAQAALKKVSAPKKAPPPPGPVATLRLGAQGRVVIPAALRKALGVKPGDALVAEMKGDELVITTRSAVHRRIQAMFKDIEPGVSWSQELIRERREEARREALE